MILDEIVKYRKLQLEREISNVSREDMKKMALGISEPTKSFYSALKQNKLAVIAEVKKASPSKGVIQPNFNPVEIAKTYEKAGANAISCLTEEHYFQGNSKYLSDIRQNISLPILRKDFIIDEYQIYEARLIGADCILLISAILDTQTMKEFSTLADSLGLDCLFEVHNEEELESVLKCNPKIVGINNRNLKTFDVSLKNTQRLAKLVPNDCVLVSESGIVTNQDMKDVKNYGADAVLIGETLMRSGDVSETFKTLREDV